MTTSPVDDRPPSSVPPPIPGEPVDPSPRQFGATLAKVDDKGAAAGSLYRAFLRFSQANVPLLAAGTTYFVFLAVFSILVVIFGLTALLGAEALADTVTQTVERAFPGLVGDQGISPQTLQEVGQTTSTIGLLVLLYSGTGSMVALSNSMHLIYGAPKDPRNFVVARVRLLAWMLLLVPMIGLSFLPSVVISVFTGTLVSLLGISGGFWTIPVVILSVALSIALSASVVWLILGHLGGIRPPRRPRLIGAVVGAFGMEVLTYLLSFIVAWSVSKPQYGALAAPIAMMLVLYLEVLVIYLSACLVAGIASAATEV